MDDTKTVLVDIVGQDLDFLVDRLQGRQHNGYSIYVDVFTGQIRLLTKI